MEIEDIQEPLMLSEEIYSINNIKSFFSEKFAHLYKQESLPYISGGLDVVFRIFYAPLLLLLFGILQLVLKLEFDIMYVFMLVFMIVFLIYYLYNRKLENSHITQYGLSKTEVLYFRERRSHYFYHHNHHLVVFIVFFLLLESPIAILGFILYSTGMIGMIYRTLQFEKQIKKSFNLIKTKDGFSPYPSRFPFILPISRKMILLSTKFYENYIEQNPRISIVHPLRIYFNYPIKKLGRFRIIHVFLFQIGIPGLIGASVSFIFRAEVSSNPYLVLFIGYVTFLIFETLMGYFLNKIMENFVLSNFSVITATFDKEQRVAFMMLLNIFKQNFSQITLWRNMEINYLGLLNNSQIFNKGFNIIKLQDLKMDF